MLITKESNLESSQAISTPSKDSQMQTVSIQDLPDKWFVSPTQRERFTAESIVEIEDSALIGSKRVSIQLVANSARSSKPIHLYLHLGRMGPGQKLSLRISLKGIRNKVKLGDRISGSWRLYLFGRSRVSIGSRSRAEGVELYANQGCSCRIGDDCMMSENVVLQSGDGHSLIDLEKRQTINQKRSSIRIGDHCWLGRNSVVLASAREVSMGSGSVLGLGSILTRTMPPTSLAAGIPARILRSRVSWHYQQRLDPQQIALLCDQFTVQG